MRRKTTKITRDEGAIPIPDDCIANVPETNWKGEYFNNRTLSGSPVMVRDDGAGSLNFDWGLGSPSSACGVNPDNFSVRWTRMIYFSTSGTYRFNVTSDDGVRLYVDDEPKLNKWIVRGPTTDTIDVSLTAGNHTLKMEYFEAGGGAIAKLSWEPVSSGCMASVPAGHWKGEYFNNTSLSGNPVMVRDDGAGNLNFDWGLGSPSSACGVNPDNFSVRWTRQVDILEDTYRFTVTTDDGVRLYIDDEPKLNKWIVRGPTSDIVDVALTRGIHRFRMEYFEAGGGAIAKLSWEPVPSDCINSVLETNWKGEYFNNQTLSDSPVMVRDDGAGSLNFDWGLGSPSSACGVNPDNFSVRWTRSVYFSVSGTYRFTVTTDDGVKLYVDDDLKLDNWIIRAPTTDTVEVTLTEGNHILNMEYFEAGGGATAKLSWELLPTNCERLTGDAAAICNTYLALRDHSGWWNNYTTGTLTPQKFLGLILRMEFSDSGGAGANNIEFAMQQETTVRNFYAHFPYWEGRPGDTRLADDIFIFLERKMLLRIGGRSELILPKDADSETISAKWKDDPGYSQADFEYGFLNPGEWVDGIGKQNEEGLYTAPMDWGNISMLTDPTKHEEAKALIESGIQNAEGIAENKFYRVRGSGNSFVILTLSQRRYWK